MAENEARKTSWIFSYLHRCFSEESCVSIPDVEGYVVVLQPDAPQISLRGSSHFARPASDFEDAEGVLLFPDIQISCSISHQVEAKKDESWHGTGQLRDRSQKQMLWDTAGQGRTQLLETENYFAERPQTVGGFGGS